ncbi:hypothetical protein JL475_33900 [Streptomyces sp. M2CJ-2]|uniref:hypothetical protein n=1 Tax=Streptomyces sp. M2CJ-2 TaxID=2803948 RepID=UPI00192727F1|nr:hypothetical protein [Streptomyces sp. M2CJ-2]MBL3670862.1 hypothetical protein [Streptomyces sp. M2CJ-2]
MVPERCGSRPDRKMDALNNLAATLSREQTTLLTTMAHQYLMERTWPVWHFTVATLDRQDLDAEELIRSLPRVGSNGHVGPSYGLTSHIGTHIADDERPALTIAAALHVPELRPYVSAPFLQVLQTLIVVQRSAPISTQEAAKPRFTIADIERELPGLPEGFAARLPGILALEPATWGGSSGGTTAEGNWWRELRREIRQYREATTLMEYVRTTARLITAQAGASLPTPATPLPAPVPQPTPGPYVDEGLITDLEDKDTVFRVDKLVALVRELNANYADEHPYTCQMLLRAILDHVPPAFGQSTFQGVVANVSWGRTDKAYVKKLADFRNGADDVLHRQINIHPSRIDMHDLPPRTYLNALLQGVLVHLPVVQQPQNA